MASSGSLAAGTTSYSSTLTAGTADLVEFLDRYAYLAVTNLSADALLYVRTDGQAASDATGRPTATLVPPGDTRLFANAMGIWYPSSRVIPQGELEFGGGNTASEPVEPRGSHRDGVAGRADGQPGHEDQHHLQLRRPVHGRGCWLALPARPGCRAGSTPKEYPWHGTITAIHGAGSTAWTSATHP